MKRAGCLNINQRENRRCQVSKKRAMEIQYENRPKHVRYANKPSTIKNGTDRNGCRGRVLK